jgi:hypothetical protein
MLHPDARISATTKVQIQSHPGERWTVSCCALNKRDGRSLTLFMMQLLYCQMVALIVVEKSAERQMATTIYLLRTCVENMVSQIFKQAGKRSIS